MSACVTGKLRSVPPSLQLTTPVTLCELPRSAGMALPLCKCRGCTGLVADHTSACRPPCIGTPSSLVVNVVASRWTVSTDDWWTHTSHSASSSSCHSRRHCGQLLRNALRCLCIRCGGPKGMEPAASAFSGTRDSWLLQDGIKDLSSLHPVTAQIVWHAAPFSCYGALEIVGAITITITSVVGPSTAQPAVALSQMKHEGAQNWLDVSHKVLCELCRDRLALSSECIGLLLESDGVVGVD